MTAQAHALHAAAAFIEHAGIDSIDGVQVTAGYDRLLIICVQRRAGSAAGRTAAVARLAAAAGAPPPTCTTCRSGAWVTASGRIAGHPASFTTTIYQHEEEEETP